MEIQELFNRAVAVTGKPDPFGWRIGVCDFEDKLQLRGEFASNSQAQAFMESMLLRGYTTVHGRPETIFDCDYLYKPLAD